MRLIIIDDLCKNVKGLGPEHIFGGFWRDALLMDYIIEDIGGGRYKALKDRSGLLPDGDFSLETLWIAIQKYRMNHI